MKEMVVFAGNMIGFMKSEGTTDAIFIVITDAGSGL